MLQTVTQNAPFLNYAAISIMTAPSIVASFFGLIFPERSNATTQSQPSADCFNAGDRLILSFKSSF